MKRTRLAVLVAVVLTIGAFTPAQAQLGPNIKEQCEANGGSGQMCRGLLHLTILAGTECRLIGGGDICTELDGRLVNPAALHAASNSWVVRTLAAQRVLDDTEPLHRELWAHTHNSFNAEEYQTPTLYGSDPNQVYTIPHQLDMGIRAVEVDLHWAPSIASPPNAVLVCHGTQINLQLATVHAGCLPTDPLIGDRLPEINTWLDAHPGEIVMLYLENQMQQNGVDSPDAHTQAANAIKAAFGDKIYTPPAGNGCADLPLDISRADIRKSGKQIIITGNCFSGGTSPWNGLVFSRSDRWKESGLDYGDDFTPERCAHDRLLANENYPHNWIRHWGDETGLSNSDPTHFPPGGGGDVTVSDATNMVRCGVNMIGFDNLVPFDARLAALAWSWADNEPQQFFNGACAVSGADARFRSADCSVQTKTIIIKKKGKKPITQVITLPFIKHRYACWDGSNWHISAVSARFGYGAAECQFEGLGTFDVPRSGYTNELLRTAKASAGTDEVWVNYAYNSSASGFVPGS